MSSCPFCHNEIREDLALHGGTCPHCFADIPGEETATDPGEDVKAQLAADDQARARRRALLPVFLAVPLVAAIVVYAVIILQPRERVERLELGDDFGIDIELSEYVEPEPGTEDDAVAEAPTDKAPTPSRPRAKSTTTDVAAGGSAEAPTEADDDGAPAQATTPGGLPTFAGMVRREAPLLTKQDDLRNAVRDLIQGKSRRLTQCYERSLKGNESLRGKWRLSFTIGTDGEIGDVGATGMDMQDAAFEQCLEREMDSWTVYGRLAKPWPVSLPINFSGS